MLERKKTKKLKNLLAEGGQGKERKVAPAMATAAAPGARSSDNRGRGNEDGGRRGQRRPPVRKVGGSVGEGHNKQCCAALWSREVFALGKYWIYGCT